MSIGAVQLPREGLGKEYKGSLKLSNSSDFWATRKYCRSVFRNYSMLHEWWVKMHVCARKKNSWTSIKCITRIIWWSTIKKQPAWVYGTSLTKTFHAFRHFYLSDLSHARIVLHEDCDSYLSNLSINVITLHQSEVSFVGKQIFQKLGFACEPSFLPTSPHPTPILQPFYSHPPTCRAVRILKSSFVAERLLRRRCTRVAK